MTILIVIATSFLLASLIRRFGSHTLLNGYMSKEKADEVFPPSDNPKKR